MLRHSVPEPNGNFWPRGELPGGVGHIAAERVIDQETPLITQGHSLPLTRLANNKILRMVTLNDVPCPLRRRRFFFHSANHHQTTRVRLRQARHRRHEAGQGPFRINAATAVENVALLADGNMPWHRVDVPQEHNLATPTAPDTHR